MRGTHASNFALGLGELFKCLGRLGLAGLAVSRKRLN